ncbi:MAG TPA: hypothetical protein VE268_03360 [Herpetosiphonaceae bacterium]|nr:hypothetical protein [Herpetosiphonaceae bacterium]
MDEPQDAIEVAVATLASQLNLAPEEISVAEVRPVTWPDSSLGCPKPGMMYTQVLTPGYQIKLVRADKEYIMHTDRGHRAVQCPDGGIMRDPGMPT